MDKLEAKQIDPVLPEWDYSRDLVESKQGEAYHRKMMEYFKEEIKLIEELIEKQEKEKKQ